LRVSKTIFGKGPLLRIVGISLGIGGLVVAGAKLAFPLMPLNFVGPALLAIPLMLAYCAVMVGLHVLLRPQVRLDGKRISRFHGQTGRSVNVQDITRARLVILSAEHVQLRVKSEKRTLTTALPASIELRQLLRFLPDLEVADKRAVFAAIRREVDAGRVSSNSMAAPRTGLCTSPPLARQ
jgi:hypothetical protein